MAQSFAENNNVTKLPENVMNFSEANLLPFFLWLLRANAQ